MQHKKLFVRRSGILWDHSVVTKCRQSRRLNSLRKQELYSLLPMQRVTSICPYKDRLRHDIRKLFWTSVFKWLKAGRSRRDWRPVKLSVILMSKLLVNSQYNSYFLFDKNKLLTRKGNRAWNVTIRGVKCHSY